MKKLIYIHCLIPSLTVLSFANYYTIGKQLNQGIDDEAVGNLCAAEGTVLVQTSVMELLLLLLMLSPCVRAVYRPHISLTMKNTTLHWRQKAAMHGRNVCAKETVWDSAPKTYDVAWSGGSLCVSTSIKFECCEGWMKVPGEGGCPQALPTRAVTTTADSVNAGLFMRSLVFSGLEKYVRDNRDPVTIFAPPDSSITSTDYHQLGGKKPATRLVDAPPLLLSHIVLNRHRIADLNNDQLLSTIAGHLPIRINVYPNGLVTANCIPVVTRDATSSGPLVHTVASILPQNHIFPIADMVMREIQARKFASYLIQSRLDELVRSMGPFTLFLPTDAALDALGPHHAHALRYDETALRALVLNHIVDGVQCSIMLNDAILRTHHNERLISRCRRSSGTFIQGGLIFAADKMATNGVIHLIDRVLVPRRAMLLIELLRALGLTTLAAMVERGGLSSMFVSPDTFTIFAPTNSALRGYERLNSSQARTLALNHMVSRRVLTSSLKMYEELISRGTREPVTVRLTQDSILVDAAKVITADVQGLNGVVHVMDRVIQPPMAKTILQWLRDQQRFSEFLYVIRILQPDLYAQLDSNSKEKISVFAIDDVYMANKYKFYYHQRILGHHFLRRGLVSEEIPANGRVVATALNGYELVLMRSGRTMTAGSAQVLQRDILCSNGVIHLVRDVIFNPGT